MKERSTIDCNAKQVEAITEQKQELFLRGTESLSGTEEQYSSLVISEKPMNKL